MNIFKYSFSLVLAFYGQPYVMALRNQLMDPSMKRLTKISRIATGFNIVLYTLFGVIGYWVFGDKYIPHLLILRKSLSSMKILETFFRIGLVSYFVLTFIGICSFNPTLRDNLLQYFILGDEGEFIVKESRVNL